VEGTVLKRDTGDAITATLLFVDDEQNILSSLKRLFRPTGHTILTAGGGDEALAILEQQTVDLVISDMRMPGMDGAQLLARVAKKYPDTMRILLTGFADMEATIRAVNEGNIYKYISKPWEDNDIKISVRHALEIKYLQAERDRLLELTTKQNEELKDLNANLEKKVEERTEALKQAHESLRKNYFSSIKIFSNLIELHEGSGTGHSKRVAENSQKVALKLGLDQELAQQVFFAALLHDVGKIALSEDVNKRPFNALSSAEKKTVAKHPVLGDALLMGFEPLTEASKIVRSHHEYLDGSGYPDMLSGDEIPMGARILAVISDYDSLINGMLVPKRLTAEEARQYLITNKGRLYDPKVVDAFLDIPAHDVKSVASSKIKVEVSDLKPGMVLANDLVTRSGILLLSEGYILNEILIEKISRFCKTTGEEFDVQVLMKQVK
jgi:putative nucleotidyltransferase with HDIG domain